MKMRRYVYLLMTKNGSVVLDGASHERHMLTFATKSDAVRNMECLTKTWGPRKVLWRDAVAIARKNACSGIAFVDGASKQYYPLAILNG